MKVLVAVDHTDASKKAVNHVGKLLSGHAGDLSVTLFHVVESLPEFLATRRETGGVFQQVAKEWAEHNQEAGEKLLKDFQAELVGMGVPSGSLHEKLSLKHALPEARRVVAALSIIEEMKEGDYDVVVIGRRGSTPAALTFLGGVAEKVVREAHGKTVWIVD